MHAVSARLVGVERVGEIPEKMGEDPKRARRLRSVLASELLGGFLNQNLIASGALP
jgi:hypothetical protein